MDILINKKLKINRLSKIKINKKVLKRVIILILMIFQVNMIIQIIVNHLIIKIN